MSNDDVTDAGLPAEPLNQESEETIMKLSSIAELGFTDDNANLKILKRFEYDLEKTIDFLLLNASTSPAHVDTTASNLTTTSGNTSVGGTVMTSNAKRSRTTTSMDKMDKVFAAVLNPTPGSNSDPNNKTFGVGKPKVGRKNCQPNPGGKVMKIGLPHAGTNINGTTPVVAPPVLGSGTQGEDCLICCVEFPTAPQYWQVLKCQHKVCNVCWNKITTSGTTMSGQQHTFTKCPFCQTCSGVEIGSCPIGNMTTYQIPGFIPGYEQFGTIQINYNISQGKYKLNRTAFLPASPEGNRVCNLLAIAWNRRLTFSIGTSMTTGQQDTLVWNVHHKTSVQGSVQSHGYPDPTYLDRVKDELKQYNIE